MTLLQFILFLASTNPTALAGDKLPPVELCSKHTVQCFNSAKEAPKLNCTNLKLKNLNIFRSALCVQVVDEKRKSFVAFRGHREFQHNSQTNCKNHTDLSSFGVLSCENDEVELGLAAGETMVFPSCRCSFGQFGRQKKAIN